ncbi:MAG: 50S ribosomal protein L20 [Bacteroides sp.]|nr:MAG: 50S ribosomal protein L20 [Bacteroides sp.]
MSRSVNVVSSRKRRKKILKSTKGYWGARKNIYKVAKNAHEKALLYAYRDRKDKKHMFRRLWIQRINSFVRQYGMTYSVFINKLYKKNICLNRKTLASMAFNNNSALNDIINGL